MENGQQGQAKVRHKNQGTSGQDVRPGHIPIPDVALIREIALALRLSCTLGTAIIGRTKELVVQSGLDWKNDTIQSIVGVPL